MDAPRYATTARHWAYPWGMGASLGVSAVGLYYLAHYQWGWAWGVEPAFALWLALFGGIPALGAAGEWLAVITGAFARGLLGADDDLPEDVGAVITTPAATPLVGGYLLSEPEQHTYEGLLRLFQHAAAANSLTSTALIGPAFHNWEHWTYWTNLAAKSGFCLKANGVTTQLPQGRTYAWAVGEIRKGNIIWPDGDSPAPQPLPQPFSAGLVYKVEAQKAGKGGPKVGEHDDN